MSCGGYLKFYFIPKKGIGFIIPAFVIDMYESQITLANNMSLMMYSPIPPVLIFKMEILNLTGKNRGIPSGFNMSIIRWLI